MQARGSQGNSSLHGRIVVGAAKSTTRTGPIVGASPIGIVPGCRALHPARDHTVDVGTKATPGVLNDEPHGGAINSRPQGDAAQVELHQAYPLLACLRLNVEARATAILIIAGWSGLVDVGIGDGTDRGRSASLGDIVDPQPRRFNTASIV